MVAHLCCRDIHRVTASHYMGILLSVLEKLWKSFEILSMKMCGDPGYVVVHSSLLFCVHNEILKFKIQVHQSVLELQAESQPAMIVTL